MDTYVERIDNALRVLRSIEDEDFQINAWPRCVLGHCAQDGWFNENGFGFHQATGRIPAFEGETGCTAGARFFGIPPEVSVRLFIVGEPFFNSAYTSRQPRRKEAIAHLEILRMKQLAAIDTGTKIDVRVEDFVAAE